jgi:hypothetical protein
MARHDDDGPGSLAADASSGGVSSSMTSAAHAVVGLSASPSIVVRAILICTPFVASATAPHPDGTNPPSVRSDERTPPARPAHAHRDPPTRTSTRHVPTLPTGTAITTGDNPGPVN